MHGTRLLQPRKIGSEVVNFCHASHLDDVLNEKVNGKKFIYFSFCFDCIMCINIDLLRFMAAASLFSNPGLLESIIVGQNKINGRFLEILNSSSRVALSRPGKLN